MLTRFLGKKKVLLVPASFLNAVANALNNIFSPAGTVSAKLEGEGEGSNIRIDIVPVAAAREMKDSLAAYFPCKHDSSLIGEGLVWNERGLSIDKEWLRREILKV